MAKRLKKKVEEPAPTFKVTFPDKDYHFRDEGAAVMFAMRYSRDLGISTTVYDPMGNTICRFGPRKYPPMKYRVQFTYGDGLQSELVARFRAPSSKPRKQLKRKKVSGR